MLSLPIYNYIQSHSWVWPTLESLHFIGLCILFGSLVIVDIRLAGGLKNVPVKGVMRFVRFTLVGFCINLVTGILFILGDPERYFVNSAFQLKMLFIGLAGINAAYLSIKLSRSVLEPQTNALPTFNPSLRIKLTAIVSLCLWIGVIVLGRFIPYAE